MIIFELCNIWLRSTLIYIPIELGFYMSCCAFSYLAIYNYVKYDYWGDVPDTLTTASIVIYILASVSLAIGAIANAIRRISILLSQKGYK